MRKHELTWGTLVFGSLGLMASLMTSRAWADGVNVQTFNQATGATYETSEPGFLDRGPLGTVPVKRGYTLGVHYHFADNPLVEYERGTDNRKQVLVDGIHTLSMSVGYLNPEWGAYLVLPTHGVRLEGASYAGALGDIKVQGKYQVAVSEDGKRGFVLVPEIQLPTGNRELFVSNGGFGIGFRGALEQEFNGFTAAANLGVLLFGNAVYRDIDYRNQIPYSLAVSVPVDRKIAVNAEFFQSLTVPFNSIQKPGELYLGGKWAMNPDTLVNAGLSVGQVDFLKSNDVRVHLGMQIKLTPEPRDRLPSSLDEWMTDSPQPMAKKSRKRR